MNPGGHRTALQDLSGKLYLCGHKTPFSFHKGNLPTAAHRSGNALFRPAKEVPGNPKTSYHRMKKQMTKYIKVRMTLEEVELFKKEASSSVYKTVSSYVRKALEEYTRVDVRQKLKLIQALGEFYRKYHNELSHIGGNLNQSVKRANELSVAGLLPPEYLREVLMPVIRETQDTLNEIKRELEEVTKKAVKL